VDVSGYRIFQLDIEAINPRSSISGKKKLWPFLIFSRTQITLINYANTAVTVRYPVQSVE